LPVPNRTCFLTLAMLGTASGALAQSSSPLAADVAQFRAEFMAVDRSYSDASRQAAERRLAALEAALPTLTPP
jgi:phosphate uptake regulator